MRCEKVRRLLNPLIEGELEGYERSETEVHLQSCSACHYELEGLRRTVGLVESMPALIPPTGLASAVMAKVLRYDKSFAAAKDSPLAWIAAAVLAGLGALVLYGYLGEAGLPWDPSVLAEAQPIGLDSLASLMASLEIGVLIGATLLFAGMAGLLVHLMGREQHRLHG